MKIFNLLETYLIESSALNNLYHIGYMINRDEHT